MNWFCVICLYLLVQFCHSTPQHNNHRNGYEREIAVAMDKGKNTAAAEGCLHNSTMFADTSIVPTSEPCLVCKCMKRNLLCVRRVCKDQPYPPPRGCILVYKKSLCCPYLSCSKYHVNYYKNAERNREQHRENDYHQKTHEKISEKHYRTDDTEEMNGGCIESGSLYASGSAMYRSSATTCTYCYCINGQQKCIKPKCMLRNTKCKPIFMEASCCPIKYDCNNNSNSSAIATSSNVKHQHGSLNKFALVKRKNRSNGCVVGEKQFHEGERLPQDDERPCEVCYCIKGMRKCTVKKCAPVIRGCIPKVPSSGSCCPTSYDCRRSIKFKRESRQGADEDEAEEEEDTDTIDFFSLLFGSDDPKENEEAAKEEIVTQSTTSTTTTPPPFKALPSSTESSFFDLIRAGLEMIDANADKIDSHLNSIVPTSLSSSTTDSTATEKTLTETSTIEVKTSTTLNANEMMTKKQPSAGESLSVKLPTTAMPIKSVSSDEKTTTIPAVVLKSSTMKMSESATKTTTIRTTKAPKIATTTITVKQSSPLTTSPPSTTSAKVNLPIITTSTTSLPMTSTTTRLPTTTVRKSQSETSKRATATKRPTTTTSTMRTTSSKKYIVPSILQSHHHQRIPVQFNADVLPDTKLSVNRDENEADTLPNLEIIPFVAHDAIKTDKYEPYRPSPTVAAANSDNLEKDYFVGDKEKPFRYNNKFIHHNYDDTLDYVYTNPHIDRIDNGPFYYETNDNQFDAFSPPNEQDFLGGFSPKESIYDEVPSTSANYELPLKRNDYAQKPLDTTTAVAAHENKSNLTSTEKSVVTLAINQTKAQQQHEQSTVPNFKKISTNFTSFIDDLLQANVLDEATTSKAPVTAIRTTKLPAATRTSTSVPIKSIINDDDFIIKHLRASTSTAATTTTTRGTPGLMEIFSKPSNPSMNGLLKLAGCNIYGQMYEVGHVIDELSNECLECKCLPDIGVGCVPLKC